MPEGTFKCGSHDFATDSVEDFAEHNADFSHSIKGIAPCNQCGLSSEFAFTGKMGTKPPALCADCKAMLLEGST